jgi:(p)ppGpp synthase/HD superfamily hydrolase
MSHDLNLARNLAWKFHAGQMYGNEPYTVHLTEVADSVEAGTTDERLVLVAYLHDILEDTACTAETLSALFEDNVVSAVVAITRSKDESKADYLLRVKANPMARMVKLHDSFCNLRASLMRFDAKRVKKYTEQIAFLVSDATPSLTP